MSIASLLSIMHTNDMNTNELCQWCDESIASDQSVAYGRNGYGEAQVMHAECKTESESPEYSLR